MSLIFLCITSLLFPSVSAVEGIKLVPSVCVCVYLCVSLLVSSLKADHLANRPMTISQMSSTVEVICNDVMLCHDVTSWCLLTLLVAHFGHEYWRASQRPSVFIQYKVHFSLLLIYTFTPCFSRFCTRLDYTKWNKRYLDLASEAPEM